MVRAGVEGFREGAAGAEGAEPTALGVTVLTSEPEATAHLLHQRVGVGLDGGCQGFVCSALDIAAVRQLAPSALLVTPGIRPEGAPAEDQARVATPRQALDAGAGLLVVGRPVTRAEDPVAGRPRRRASASRRPRPAGLDRPRYGGVSRVGRVVALGSPSCRSHRN